MLDVLFIDISVEKKKSTELKFYNTALLQEYLRAAGLSCNSIDFGDPGRGILSSELSHEDAARQIFEDVRAHVYGFCTAAHNLVDVLLMAEAMKRVDPAGKTLLGGPQASFVARALMERFPAIDAVVVGEADAVIADVVGALRRGGGEYLGDVPSVVYRREGRAAETRRVDTAFDLDALPRIDYSQGVEEAADGDAVFIRVETGRGCAGRCVFCSTSRYWRSVGIRTRDVEVVVGELREQLSVLGDGRRVVFRFLNDNCTRRSSWFEELLDGLQALKREQPGLAWICQSRVDSLVHTSLARMRDAGCEGVYLGVETGSSGIGAAIRKRVDRTEVVGLVREGSRLGLSVFASFIVGFPDESAADLEQTLSLALELRCLGAITEVGVLTFFAGTELVERYGEGALVRREDVPSEGMSRFRFEVADVDKLIEDREVFVHCYYEPNAHGIEQRDHAFVASACELLFFTCPQSTKVFCAALELGVAELLLGCARSLRRWRPVEYRAMYVGDESRYESFFGEFFEYLAGRSQDELHLFAALMDFESRARGESASERTFPPFAVRSRVDLVAVLEAAGRDLGMEEAERTPGALQWGVLREDGLCVARIEASEGRIVADEELDDLRGCRSLDEVRQWGRERGVDVKGRTVTR